jgi:hypothetical protein
MIVHSDDTKPTVVVIDDDSEPRSRQSACVLCCSLRLRIFSAALVRVSLGALFLTPDCQGEAVWSFRRMWPKRTSTCHHRHDGLWRHAT